MKSKLPTLLQQTKVCIICEGDEEFEYLEKLKELDVWNGKYDIVLENADGNGNVPARYQDKYQNGSFDVVLLFCDTDRKPYEQYIDIKRKIDEFHGVEGAADEDQRQQVFGQITKENYADMLDRVKKLPDADNVVGSSNFGNFMEYFSDENDSWVEEINGVLEG